jgi:hypothetical protein
MHHHKPQTRGGGDASPKTDRGGGFDRQNSLKRKGGGEGFSSSFARETAVPITTLKLPGRVGVIFFF